MNPVAMSDFIQYCVNTGLRPVFFTPVYNAGMLKAWSVGLKIIYVTEQLVGLMKVSYLNFMSMLYSWPVESVANEFPVYVII